MTKLNSFSDGEKIIFFLSKNAIYSSWVSMKGIQASGEASNPLESTQHFKSIHFPVFSLLFLVIFVHLDPDPAIQNQCGSESSTLAY
jgi:hypothetical protein